MARRKLKSPRPPAKAPSLPHFTPRLWCIFDGWWTQDKAATEPGYWQNFCDVNFTPMYDEGQLAFIINLAFGQTGKGGATLEYDAGLYRSGTWVSELVPTFTAYKKAHPGLVLMFYMGDMITVFRNPDGSGIDMRPQANLDAAQKRIEQATAQIAPVADFIAVDGSARYDPALIATADPANGGIYAWLAQRAKDAQKQSGKPIVVEAMPAASNKWAMNQPWICQDDVFEMDQKNPLMLHDAPAGQERIVLLHSIPCTDPQWIPKIELYRKAGYSVAPMALAAYVLNNHKPLNDVLRNFNGS